MISALKSIFRIHDAENRALNGFRAIAIIMVMIFHFASGISAMGIFKTIDEPLNYILCNYNSAVDLFFILSGFLISGGLYHKWMKNKNEFFKSFYIKRALKIFPAYYFFMIITILYFLMLISKLKTMPQTETISTYLAYLIDCKNKSLYDFLYITNIIKGGQPHTWALSTEVQFYLLFPVFGYFILFKLRPATRIIILSCLYLVQFSLRIFVASTNVTFESGIDIMYVLDSMRFDSIIIGIIIMDLYYNIDGFMSKLTGPRSIIMLIAGIAFLAVAHLHMYVMPGFLGEHLKYNLNNIGYGFLVIAGLSNNQLWTKFLSLRFWTPVARVSYNMYLWQFLTPFLSIDLFFNIKKMTFNYFNYSLLCIIYIVFTFIFAILLYCITEYPFIRIKNRV